MVESGLLISCAKKETSGTGSRQLLARAERPRLPFHSEMERSEKDAFGAKKEPSSQQHLLVPTVLRRRGRMWETGGYGKAAPTVRYATAFSETESRQNAPWRISSGEN
jgi:hypothetical protein